MIEDERNYRDYWDPWMRGATLRQWLVAFGAVAALVAAFSRGKAARAEPVAALFESGKARFAGAFPELEDELAGLTAGGGYSGPGRGSHRSGPSMGSRSPDRGDAMVWAMTELAAPKRAEPRVRRL